ncbi:MAG: hypothetical protein WC389_18920 [Lutibacter sp.]|jgi:hypothetical protein
MDDPGFIFYPGDYLRDTQCLSEKVQVAYDRIMCEHMRQICITHEQLNFFTKRLSQDEKQELMFVLSKKDTGFVIRWVSESIEKRRSYSESRRSNRSKPNKSHMITHDKDMRTYDDHMDNENEIEDDNTVKDKIKNEDKKKIKEITWRNDFNTYKKIVDETYQYILIEQAILDELQRLNPGLDIKLSLEKSIVNFWGTEAGWKHKKKSRSMDIDMLRTLKSNIDKNKVYLPRQNPYQQKMITHEDLLNGVMSIKPEDLPD